MGHQSKAPDNDVPLQLLGIYMVHQSKASANEMFSHVIRELFAHMITLKYRTMKINRKKK